MWIVKVALERPYTFIVLAILILLMGVFAILRMARDIFPNINIPVISGVFALRIGADISNESGYIDHYVPTATGSRTPSVR